MAKIYEHKIYVPVGVTEGLAGAAMHIGKKLKDYFPYQEDDINEQPDEISFGQQEEDL